MASGVSRLALEEMKELPFVYFKVAKQLAGWLNSLHRSCQLVVEYWIVIMWAKLVALGI